MMISEMPPKSKLKLPPIDLGKETLGERLARLRKERGYTQVELAEKIGTIQVIVSNYERDRLRMHAEMVARFAKALDVTADVLLGLQKDRARKNGNGRPPKIPRRILRRVEQIEGLPSHHQRALLKTIDTFLKGAQA
jgi:transcriptional regulator with XRE-family HTH domain